MAHECPECLTPCHCNGDIDDIMLPDSEAEITCTHCVCEDCGECVSECDCFGDDDDDDRNEERAISGSFDVDDAMERGDELRDRAKDEKMR